MSKILLIDRDIAQGNLVMDSLKGRSYEIAFVHSVKEALAIFQRELFDLILLDIAPETDAMAAVQEVTKEAEHVFKKKIPLIVFTKSFSESSFLLDTAEVDVLLEFPVHAEQLNQVVEQFVGCKLT